MANLINAEDILAIKARVKAELSRRFYTGDISKYGGDAYDYSKNPEEGKILGDPQFINKIITPLSAINDIKDGDNNTITVQSKDDLIKNYAYITGFLSTAENQPLVSGSPDCKASCSGLCHSTCGASCASGCEATCTDSCGGDCTSGCTGTCTGTCSTGCTGCTGSCSGCTSCSGCSGSCSGSCSGTCSGCSGSCTGSCYTCSQACTGCAGCTGNCSGSCTGQAR